MTTKARVGRKGQSSVFTAVIMALAIIAIIAAVAVSWPMIKSTFDKNYWSGSMGTYNLRFANSSYAYAQNGVGGQVGTSPTPIGYCIALSTSTTYAVSTCPSTTPSYQSPPSSTSPPPSNNGGGGSSGSGGSSGGSSNGGGNNNYYVYVTVTGDSYGAGWEIISSASSISGTSNVNNEQLPIGGQTDTLIAQISSPSGYACSISPSSEQVTSGNSYTFTVSCVQSPYPPCTVEPPSVSSSPSGAPTPTSSASVSSIPYGQSEQVTFYYNAPESGNNYIFQYWSIGGQTYYQTNPSITETLACTTPGGTLTGPSGTAYYQYQPPGTISIDPDTIDLTQSSETYKFTWTSAWSGTGTFTYSFTGTVNIFYGQPPGGSVAWTATVSLPGNTIAASGTGDLNITNYPEPPNPYYYVSCTVSGGGTVNGVSAGAGIEYGTAYITCTLESKNGK